MPIKNRTTEVIRYCIPAENAAAFEQAYQLAEPILRGSPHCLGYQLLHGVEAPENWLLLIEWDSVEGHERGFRRDPAFREFLELVKPFFTAIQEMKHYAPRPMAWTR